MFGLKNVVSKQISAVVEFCVPPIGFVPLIERVPVRNVLALVFRALFTLPPALVFSARLVVVFGLALRGVRRIIFVPGLRVTAGDGIVGLFLAPLRLVLAFGLGGAPRIIFVPGLRVTAGNGIVGPFLLLLGLFLPLFLVAPLE